MTNDELNAIGATALKWLESAKRRMANSEREPNEMGAKLIFHGGMVHLNCATDLLMVAGMMPDEALLSERGESLYSFLLEKFGEHAKGPGDSGLNHLRLDLVPDGVAAD